MRRAFTHGTFVALLALTLLIFARSTDAMAAAPDCEPVSSARCVALQNASGSFAGPNWSEGRALDFVLARLNRPDARHQNGALASVLNAVLRTEIDGHPFHVLVIGSSEGEAHANSARVSFFEFAQSNGSWHLTAEKVDAFLTGSWGKISGKAQMLDFAGPSYAVAVPGGGTWQGYSTIQHIIWGSSPGEFEPLTCIQTFFSDTGAKGDSGTTVEYALSTSENAAGGRALAVRRVDPKISGEYPLLWIFADRDGDFGPIQEVYDDWRVSELQAGAQGGALSLADYGTPCLVFRGV